MRWIRIAVLLAVAASATALGLSWWRGKNRSAVQRGYAAAEAKGCFACHGPGGLGFEGKGVPNPGYDYGDVPPWSAGVMMMYAENEGEIREWIMDGLPRRIRNDPEQMKIRAKAVVAMPAWRGLLSDRELGDIVAYIKAVADLEKPQDAAALAGRAVAAKYGCFGCHGPQGRGSMPNVRAFKGYIPSWDGPDFDELARDDNEVREWILDGVCRRLAGNAAARFFLDRQPIKMPKYRGFIADEEIDQIVAYVRWLRANRS